MDWRAFYSVLIRVSNTFAIFVNWGWQMGAGKGRAGLKPHNPVLTPSKNLRFTRINTSKTPKTPKNPIPQGFRGSGGFALIKIYNIYMY
jgi:hypothetical protein